MYIVHNLFIGFRKSLSAPVPAEISPTFLLFTQTLDSDQEKWGNRNKCINIIKYTFKLNEFFFYTI